ncbi:MAG: oligopeptide/dipeptide ABC transporter ATP-binding protein [Planctomycetota bacterium]
MSDSLLSVRDLTTHFPVKRGLLKKTVGLVKAVDGVSFDILPGETLGLVGESGCGKSTVGRSILRLVPATSGEVDFDGENVLAASSSRMRALRREMQIIFQDPVGSLNPRMTVGSIIGEPLQVHGLVATRDGGSELRDRVASLLIKVGLLPEHARRYPHEFSGGQRQRIGIARALALNPRFMVCDEPVSALDVSIQGQVLNLLNDLQDELGLSYLFIAHNLAVVEHFCDRIAVMYLGRIVELADRETLYANPLHPYTRALLSAAPMPDPSAERNRMMLLGDVPSPIHYFDQDDSPAAAMSADERAEMEAEADAAEEVSFVSRASLLDRPAMVAVPGQPGHFVSPHPQIAASLEQPALT